MSRNRGSDTPANTGGGHGRGTGRIRQTRPAETAHGASTGLSSVAAAPSRATTRAMTRAPEDPTATRSNRSRVSMFRTAREVSIRGGNINSAGTNQLNLTINLGNQIDERVLDNLEQAEHHASEITQEDEDTANIQIGGHSLSNIFDNTTARTTYDIYYQHIAVHRRGSALWIPEPSTTLPIEYRRKGVGIGDVGTISNFGSFNFLFNGCLPRDHPIKPTDLPESFTMLSIPPIDITR